jgi:hypothetical protein
MDKIKSFCVVIAIIADITIGAKKLNANDSVAGYEIGGIVLQRTDSIKMVSEVLTISPNNITIDYIFKNISLSDITTIIAFPLPDLDMRMIYWHPHEFANEGYANFVNFKIFVDSKEVVPLVEVRSFLEDGNEITDTLKRLNVNPFQRDLKGTKLRAELQEIAAIDDKYDAAQWTTKTHFFWSQTFPAGKELKVQHSYHPIPWKGLVSANVDDNKEWCVDESIIRATDKLAETNKDYKPDGYVRGESVSYILKTGANWAGPIDDFTLIIEKAGADFISTCPIPGITLKRQGNSFVGRAKNYTPTKNLNILFIKPLNYYWTDKSKNGATDSR